MSMHGVSSLRHESSQAFGLPLNHSESFRGLPPPSPDLRNALRWCMRRIDKRRSAAFVRERSKSAARVSSAKQSASSCLIWK